MTTMRIAEVAQRTGVPATTLRYYEEIGLLAPAGRSGNGYREYADRDLERLAFITRAKQLDISLDELRELVGVWDDDCGQVHHRMTAVVASRVAQTQARIGELVALTAQLQAAAARLASRARVRRRVWRRLRMRGGPSHVEGDPHRVHTRLGVCARADCRLAGRGREGNRSPGDR